MYRFSFVSGLGAAVALCILPLPSRAGDWNLDRGVFESDAAKAELHGKVRQVEERRYSAAVLSNITRTSFDADGNLERSEYFALDLKSCGVSTFGYDARGFLVSKTSSTGDLAGPGDCRNLRNTWSETYTHVTDGRGAMTQLRRLDAAGKTLWQFAYAYDALGRLASVTGTSASGDRWSESYAYAPDPRGVRVARTHVSNVLNVSSNVTRELLYSPDGRLLEVSSHPDWTLLFGGNESRTYLPGGALAQIRYSSSQSAPVTAAFTGHDANGNWTLRSPSVGDRLERSIRY